MRRLALALHSYASHTTDEGDQLQRGLEHAGWTLVGHGYGDGCTHVPTLLDRYKPDAIFIQDCRDWDRDSEGCFDPRGHFDGWEALRHHPRVFTPLKDAGSVPGFQQRFIECIRPLGVVTYYHDNAVRPLVGGWLPPNTLAVRTTHSVDADLLAAVPLDGPRRRAIVTGARGRYYPLREIVWTHAGELGVETRDHPGYGNRGCDTPAYLRALAGYRVHVATASRLGFLLRKIIESVCVGCAVVTDLPEWDWQPELGPLVRIDRGMKLAEMRAAIDRAERTWELDAAQVARARAWYDWRAVGARLDAAIVAACEGERRVA